MTITDTHATDRFDAATQEHINLIRDEIQDNLERVATSTDPTELRGLATSLGWQAAALLEGLTMGSIERVSLRAQLKAASKQAS
ncbi:hypothetical protein AB0B94_30465 [Micromonospora sp. NPDC048986]|uniref:hypothetical protein n=1 Tax=Micromonospora sp. NPDC048986 TaxID=3155644 RepID=UPI0033F631EB